MVPPSPAGSGVRSLLNASSVYVASNLLGRVTPFLLLPVLSRYLSPESFGQVAMYTMAVTLVAPLVGFSTEGAIGREYFERRDIDFPSYVKTCLYFTTATTALATGALVLLSRSLAPVLALPSDWVWTLGPVCAARYVFLVVLTLLQVEQRPARYAAFSVGQSVLSAALSLYLVVGRGFAWEGRVLGEIAASAAAAGAGFITVAPAHFRGGRWNRRYLGRALGFGGGLLPHTYGGLMIASTDRLLITNMVGVADTGRYAAGAQVAAIITVLEHSFNQAWAPWLFEKLTRNDPNDVALIRRITRSYNLSILALALALSAAARPFVGTFLGADYAGAASFVFWLALGNAFTGMYKMVANQIFFANKTYLLSFVTFTTGSLNVLLTYVLISRHGAVGAAEAAAASLLLSYWMTRRLSARVMAERGRTHRPRP